MKKITGYFTSEKIETIVDCFTGCLLAFIVLSSLVYCIINLNILNL